MYFLFEFQKPEKRVAKGGGEEGGTELLSTQKMGMYFQTGYGLQSPEFNIGCKIFLSGLEAFSRGCELATCDTCVHYL